ncbi:MAG: HPr family phosphocarrier protein [Candidatus Ratteibacteria bacterium]|nr:HPr family phosphocarrier protein [Candidatus Ratteibacteria bacterium]
MEIKKDIIIANELGLHARPAALFVQTANKFNSEIFVEKSGERVNGKSIMGLMMLAAEKGSQITIAVRGDDAASALGALEKLLSGKFGES